MGDATGSGRVAAAAGAAVAPGARVRSLVSLYRGNGVGRVVKVRGDLAKVEFSPGVFSPAPQRSVSYLLKCGELEACPDPLELAQSGAWGEAAAFDLRQMAARFLAGNKGGQLSNARTEILPHQIFTAHRVVTSPKRRFMLADEVGLGKTIEAGMVWQALAQRGRAERTLIVTPAGLTRQWQEEMQEKFQAHFEIFGRDFTGTNPRTWDIRAAAIASLDRLKRREHKAILLENRRWDLIIFDEAHRLGARSYGHKTDKTQNYQLAEALRDYTDALLLLTGTPHGGDSDHSRFLHLIQLLEEKVDFTPLVDPGLFRDPEATPYGDLVLRTPKLKVTDAAGQVVFRGRRTQAVAAAMHPEERKFYEAVEDYIRTGYHALEQIEAPGERRALGFILTTFQKLNASSGSAIRAALEGRLWRLRERMLGMGPAAEGDEEDRQDEDARYQGELDVRDMLRDSRALLRDETRELEKLLALPPGRERKLGSLRDLLCQVDRESPGAKVLIFTEYRETQKFLERELAGWYGSGSTALIHGGMPLEAKTPEGDSKRRSQQRFRDVAAARFLISTEAGGEGINLQFCHIVVNYDLPWSPMRYEQRVGRVYRYGQDKVVQIYNLSAKNTVEDTVRSFFEQKLRTAAQALQAATGEDAEELAASLRAQVGEEMEETVYQRALVEGSLNRQSKEAIQAAVERARRAYELATGGLFRDVSSYSFESYRKELASPVGLADLERFALIFLERERRQVRRREAGLEFLVPESLAGPGVPARIVRGTFNRSRAVADPEAEFLAFGHPYTDAMVRHVGDYGFGGHTATRVVRKEAGEAMRAGWQFNFVVRSQVERAGANEHLFEFHTVVVLGSGAVDSALAEIASGQYSAVRPAAACAEAMLAGLAESDLEDAYEAARRHLESRATVWDWDEMVELVGVAKVAAV